MPHFELAGLVVEFERRSQDLHDLLLPPSLARPVAEQNAIAEYVAIQLQDTWTRFVRDLILRSTTGRAVMATGSQVLPGPLGVVRMSDAVDHIRAKKKQKPWWEPKWFDIKASSSALSILAPSNAAAIMAALGSSTNPIEELRSVRNFVAHRGPTSADGIAAVAASRRIVWAQPADVMVTRIAGSTLLEEWLRRFRVVARASVK